jgi:lipopolysaccharide export system protein LptA
MRRGRWLILVAIVLIAFAIGATYFQRKAALIRDAPSPPPKLATGIDGSADDWVYTQSDADRPRVTVRAKSFKQVRAPSVLQLDGVELQLFNKDGSEYDLVHSAQAEFDIPGKSLYSDGPVEIAMGVPVDGSKPSGRRLKINGSGVHFASDTGKATTEREAHFEFDQGGGSATGAEYDPTTKQLHLLHNVKLDWRGRTEDTKPMHIEAAEALYLESESKVLLMQWSKLTRDALHMEAGPATVLLTNGAVQEVLTESARGVQDDPGRKLEFGADHLDIHFGENMMVLSIKGQQNGKLVSTSKGMQTTVTSDVLDLGFQPTGKQSILTGAVATGKGVAQAQPLPQPGELLAETRILRSDTIRMQMRPNGEDIDNVVTDGPGTVDFLPNRPGQPKRWMKGDRIWIAYGADNRIQTFRSINAMTRTDKPAGDRASEKTGQPPPPQLTQSKELLATFDPKTSELARLEQKTDFRYEEGVRRGTAERATLDQAKDLMTLDGTARVWDNTGSAAGDHIALYQKTGDYAVDGHVATTRIPDDKGNPGMLSTSEMMQARAQHMTSAENNQKLHYEGTAVAWQGANRVEADRLDIDRGRHILEAHGKVVSQFLDKDKNGDKGGSTGKAADGVVTGKSVSAKVSGDDSGKGKNSKGGSKNSPIYTVIRAPDLIYDEETRIANYQGGAALARPGLTVAGRAIRAFLRDSDSDSSLDKAFADGDVKIVHTKGARTRVGTSAHAEYYTDDEKVLLDGGNPLLVDSLKGKTTGDQLTWFAHNDRLLVNGVESRPAESLLRKK